MKRFLNKNRFYIAFILIVTVLLVVFVRANLDYLKRAAGVNPGVFLLIAGLGVLNRMLNGLKIREVVNLFGVRLSFREWYGMAAITNFYNYFIPKGGVALAAAYAKKTHGFDYSKYLSFAMGDVLVVFMVSGVLGFSASVYGSVIRVFEGWFISGAFLGLAAVMAGIILLPEVRLPEKGILIKLNRVLRAWDILRKETSLVVKLFLLNLMVLVVFGLRYYILFRVFSSEVPLFVCFLISPLSLIVRMIGVVPGGYGLGEALAGFMTKLADFGFVPGTVISLIDRVIIMSLAFVQGSIFSYLLIRKSNLRLQGEER